MKKLLLVLAAVMLGPLVSARAGSMDVMLTSRSSMTTVGIDISSGNAGGTVAGPTDVTSGVNWLQVCVQNLDTTSFVACGESINVSTRTAAGVANTGTIIPPAASSTQPAQPTCFAVVAGQRYYCLTASTTATTHASLVRAR